jgi:heme O synthase-like polyprenyltransferase
MCWRLHRMAKQGEAGEAEAMRIFHFSITYLTVLFVAMAADVLLANLIRG